MNEEGARFAQAALSLVGAPFRLRGRDPQTGLDCLGLIDASLRMVGRRPVLPRRYRLRNSQIGNLQSFAEQCGFAPSTEPIAPGNVLMLHPGPAQHHFAIVAPGGRDHIHAHAGCGAVVLTPGIPAEQTAGQWRIVQDQGYRHGDTGI